MKSSTWMRPVEERVELPSQVYPGPVTRPAGRRAWAGALAAAALLVAATALVSAVFWPGHMNLDTLGELQNARTGQYTDWHSPVWSAVWRGLLLAGLRSPGWMTLGSALLLMAGLYLLLRLRLSRRWAVPAAVAIFVYPPVLSWDIEIGTDSWFASSILCGFGFAALGARTHGRLRFVSATLAGACAVLAFGARATALPAAFVLLCTVAAVTLPAAWSGWPRLLAVGAAGSAGTALVVGSVLGLQYPVLHTVQTHPEQATYDYDLVLMSVSEGRVLLPPDVYARQDLGYLRQRSNAWSIEALLFDQSRTISIPVQGAKLESLRRAWLAAVSQHPLDYLLVRRASAAIQLTITSPPYYAYFGAPPSEYGFPLQFPALHEAAMAYIAVGSTPDAPGHPGGPLDRAWVYVLVLLVAAAVSLRPRGPADAVPGLLSAALLAYTAAILLLAPTVTYRYMYPAVATGTVLAILLAVSVVGGIRNSLRPGQIGTATAAPRHSN